MKKKFLQNTLCMLFSVLMLSTAVVFAEPVEKDAALSEGTETSAVSAAPAEEAKPEETSPIPEVTPVPEATPAPEETPVPQTPEEESAASGADSTPAPTQAPEISPTPGARTAARNTAVQITNESQLEPYFPDANFRAAVFDAICDGNENAEGATIQEAIANYEGDINASKKGIHDIHGLELLTGAGVINLSQNEIEDWSFLPEDEGHYGRSTAQAGEPRNVEWKLDRNPFRLIPKTFGGRLVIDQPATHAYTYPEDEVAELIVVVRNGTLPVPAEKNIGRAKEAGSGKYIDLISIEEKPAKAGIVRFGAAPIVGNSTAKYEIIKSGSVQFAIGTDQIIHYSTTDEYDTMTPGSQSYKYYTNQDIWVYDSVKLNVPEFKGKAELSKKDIKSGNPVKDAVYSLFKADGTLVNAGLITDAQGKILATDLAAGSYFFRETAAPNNYLLNEVDAPFEIKAPAITLGGGRQSVTSAEGNTVNAGAGEVLIAGPDRDGNGESPDVTLTATNEDLMKEITLTYTKLEGTAAGSPVRNNVKRSFATAAAAAADLNTEKNANRILGAVSVAAVYKTQDAAKVAVNHTDVPKLHDYTVVKLWDDKGDADKKRPVSIEVQLYKNGTAEGGSVTLNAANNWAYTWNGLYTFVKDTNTGAHNIYTAEEVSVPAEYTVSYDNSSAVKGIIKNSYVPPKHDYTVEKNWNDKDDFAGLRPDSIEVQLYKNDIAEGGPVILNEGNSWQYTWTNLDTIKQGSTSEHNVYTVKETPVPEYTAAYDTSSEVKGLITNTIVPKDLITVKKGGISAESCAENPSAPVPLSGAKFVLYGDKELTDDLKTITSGADGSLRFTTKFAEGNYYLQETETPEGYVASAEVYKLTADRIGRLTAIMNGDGSVLKDATILNDVPKAKILLIKYAEGTDIPLQGSIYGLFKHQTAALLSAEDAPAERALELVAKATTDEDGRLTFDGVFTGVEYTVQELESPDGSYVSANPITVSFKLTDEGEVKLDSFTGGEGTADIGPDGEIIWQEPSVIVSIIKKDEAGNPLPGAKLTLTDKDGNTVDAPWVSKATPHMLERVLVVGQSYTLTETEAPAGYTLATPVRFTVSNDKVGPGEDRLIAVEMQDTPTKLQFIKVDAVSGTALAGAAFRLSGKLADGTAKAEFTLDATGYTMEKLLITGESYSLTELTAPTGYEQLKTPVTFTFGKDGMTQVTGGPAEATQKDGVWMLKISNTKVSSPTPTPTVAPTPTPNVSTPTPIPSSPAPTPAAPTVPPTATPKPGPSTGDQGNWPLVAAVLSSVAVLAGLVVLNYRRSKGK